MFSYKTETSDASCSGHYWQLCHLLCWNQICTIYCMDVWYQIYLSCVRGCIRNGCRCDSVLPSVLTKLTWYHDFTVYAIEFKTVPTRPNYTKHPQGLNLVKSNLITYYLLKMLHCSIDHWYFYHLVPVYSIHCNFALELLLKNPQSKLRPSVGNAMLGAVLNPGPMSFNRPLGIVWQGKQQTQQRCHSNLQDKCYSMCMVLAFRL